MRETPTDFTTRTCAAPPARIDRMRDIVLAHVGHVAPDRPIRLLDLGCGTGSLVFRLAEALPAAALVGVDVSAANIRAARARQAGHVADTRVMFEVADYLDYLAGPFDVIVTDGVLHLIPGDTAALVHKLASDVTAGGVLVCAMPFDCVYNRLFAVLRVALRSIRSRFVDWLILQAARGLHGRDMDVESLRERVEYMYIPPRRVMGRRLMACFLAAGFRPVTAYAMNSISPSQLKYRATVFVRQAREPLEPTGRYQ